MKTDRNNFLTAKERRKRKKTSSSPLRSFHFFAVLLLLPSLSTGAEEKFPNIKTYNRGCALYRANDFQGAEKLFAEAAVQTEDETLKQKALYNRGTALFAGTVAGQITNRLASISSAIDLFELSLELQPGDTDSKQNLERAIHLMVTGRIKQAAKLINEADQMLSQDQAETAKENYETAKKTVAPVQEDFAPNHKAIEPLISHANKQLQMLKQAIEQTRAEMKSAKRAIDTYAYKTAADLMLADKPARRWAFDLDKKLAEEFQQLLQNNQKIIEIVYPNNSIQQ